MDDRQAKAGAAAGTAGGEEQLEHPWQVGGGDAATEVNHRDDELRLLAAVVRRDGDLDRASALRERLSQVVPFVRCLKPDFLEELAESCEIEDV